MIEVPKNRLGEAIYTSKEDRDQLSWAIKTGLKRVIGEIMENREIVLRKANAALQHIKNYHSPEDYSRKLSEIYHCALQ